MGSLSMTASNLHTKYHQPPARCSDLTGIARGLEASICCFKQSTLTIELEPAYSLVSI